MRWAFAVLLAAAVAPVAGAAHAAYAPVQVTMTVDPSCTIQSPRRIAAPMPLQDINVLSLSTQCRTHVRPLLSFADDVSKGAYLATIDF